MNQARRIARAALAAPAAYAHRRRLERLHKRLVEPGRLTVAELHEACACLVGLDGAPVDPDAVMAGSVPEVRPISLALGQRFLDVTHPGSGVLLGALEARDAEAVLGVAAANFFGAPLRRRLAQLSSSTPTGPVAEAGSTRSPARAAGAASSNPSRAFRPASTSP